LVAKVKSNRAVTRIGWTALALSILAVALVVVTGWMFNLGLTDTPGLGPVPVALLPWSAIATFLTIIAAVTVASIAGTRGLGNRLVGILGGLIMAAPALYIGGLFLVGFLVTPR
jgi:hypothetical protein